MSKKEDLRSGVFTNFVESVKGAVNATRMRGMTPAQRRAFENRVIAKRKKSGRRISPEAAVSRAVRARSADAGLDLRSGVDPRAALKRRMDKVDKS